ncbi:toprim domain-containing protein [Hymenobacter endophyticus]|uniref:Toprim domain-containing protein n=1 Tax=Hymenobacter endophyticus TaxID=3076335 RepID=A0ABU3TL42_9BACT|nr:toprim domain-containing protein [Hymenobacter endophyticus]MDU0372083.1 toprim domain-containing protein [Hymenobacter endophyticus]
MSNNPQQNRPNDSGELDHFKRNIDLTAYAVAQHGYQVKEESRRGDWQKLSKEGETLIVTRKGDHQVYMNTGDDNDRGSIIDFVKSRGGAYGQGLNLGQTRQQLRQYLNEDGPQRDQKTLAEAPKPERIASLKEIPQGLSLEERRNVLIADALGVQPKLENRSYLHSRGISDQTIDNPAFQGRVFTARGKYENTAFPLYNQTGIISVEEKNTGYKHMLPLPKEGLWVSKMTEPGKPLDRLVVTESAIDALSKHQLDRRDGKPQPNTMYLATAGTVTERQVELIQLIIDRQKPKEVVLGQDNDPGGRRFNINYLNDLQPPRTRQPGSTNELPLIEQLAPPVAWHAGTSGKYSTNLKIEFNTEKAHEGRTAVSNLADRIAQLNSGDQQRDQPPLSMDVIRTSSTQTVVRVTALNADMPALELLSRELHQQREDKLQQLDPARNPGFLRIEYPQSKDFTRDLELMNQGLKGEQLSAQAQLEVQHKEEMTRQKNLQAQKEQEARDEERRQQAEQRRQEEEARKQNTPEAQKQHEQEDKAFGNALLGIAVADALTPRPQAQAEVGVAGTGKVGSAAGTEVSEGANEAYNQLKGAYQGVNGAALAQTLAETAARSSRPEVSPVEKAFAPVQAADDLQALAQLAARLNERDTRVGIVEVREAPAIPSFIIEGPAGQRESSSYANKVLDSLEKYGAEVKNTDWPERDMVRTGLESTRVHFAYKIDDERQPQLHELLQRLEKEPGVTVTDNGTAERQAAATARGTTVAVEMPERGRQWDEGTAVVLLRDTPDNRESFERAGARVEGVRTTDQEQALLIKYPLNAPEVVALVSRALDRQVEEEYKDQTGSGVGVLKAGVVYENSMAREARQHMADQQLGPEMALGVITVQEARTASLNDPARTEYTEKLSGKLAELGAITEVVAGTAAASSPAHQAGLVENRIEFAIPVNGRHEAQLVNLLDTITQQPGVKLETSTPDHAWRDIDQRYPAGNMPWENLPERDRPLLERQAVLTVTEEKLPALEPIRTTLEAQGAIVGVPERVEGVYAGPERFTVPVTYQLDSPRIEGIREAFDTISRNAPADGSLNLWTGTYIQQREQLHEVVPNLAPLAPAAPQREQEPLPWEAGQGLRAPAFEAAPEALRFPAADHPVRYTELVVADSPAGRQRLEQAAAQLQAAGATPGAITEGGEQQATLNLRIGYRIDQPELPQVHQQLQQLAQGADDVQVKDRAGQVAERTIEAARLQREPGVNWEQAQQQQQGRYADVATPAAEAAPRAQGSGAEVTAAPASAPNEAPAAPLRAPLYSEASEALRQPDTSHQVRYTEISVLDRGYNEDTLRLLRKQLQEAGATVDEIRPVAGVADQPRLGMMVGYRVDQPELPQIHQQLSDARSQDVVLIRERNGQGWERGREVENRQNDQQRTAEGPGQPVPPAVAQQQVDARQQAEESRTLTSKADQQQLQASAHGAEGRQETQQAADKARTAESGASLQAKVVVEDKPDQALKDVPNERAQRVADAFEAAGAKTGEAKAVVADNGIRRTEYDVSYRTDSPSIREINTTFERAARSNSVQVQETGEAQTLRQQAAARAEKAQPQRQASEIER